MRFKAKADEIMKTLDPIIGVAGKDAEVTFNLNSEVIEVSITNESACAMCRMAVDVSEGMASGDLEDCMITDESVTLNIDSLVGALKMFAGQKVEVCTSGKDVIIESDLGRRTMRMLEDAKTSRQVKFSAAIEITADPNDLKKLAGFDGISESIYFDIHGGRLRIGCASETETAEIFIETAVYRDHRSFYPSDIISTIVRRIHAEQDGVKICLSEDAPLCMTFDYGCTSYWIFIAPRIESV